MFSVRINKEGIILPTGKQERSICYTRNNKYDEFKNSKSVV